MNYASVCSGIEAATVAWHPLGWKPAVFAEIERFPSSVLKHHYPTVPNHGDFTTIAENDYGAINLLVGGTPCQDFSVAGLRAGMDGKRGQLTVEFAHLAGRLRPRWLVWENVPGVLSIDGGRAFGTFLGLLGKLGYGFAYRVLDAQHFGVPQRRRRVFVVGHLGDWRRAAAVLFEQHSLQGNTAPRREAGQTAPTIPSRSLGGGGLGTDFDCDGGLICDVADTLSVGANQTYGFAGDIVAHSLRAEGFDASEDGTGRGTPLVPISFDPVQCTAPGYRGQPKTLDQPSHTLHISGPPALAFSCKDHGADVGELSPTLRSMGHDGSHANAGGQVAVAMNLRGRAGGAMPEMDGLASIRAASGGSSRSYVMYEQEDNYASTYEADASSVLRTLRKQAGAEAVAEWGSRILDSLQSAEVLWTWLHGESLRRSASNFRSFVDDSPLSRPKNLSEGVLRTVWILGPNGRTPQGRGLAKQLAQQLGKTLPELPPARAQETFRSSVMAVRRLTPVECERLMGFPDDYTKISAKTADGPRYKALGNSMAVPVMRWIGERIAMVEALEAT